MRSYFDELRVFVSPLDRRRGFLQAGWARVPCALGRSGAGRKRREGDGVTPLGRFALRQLHWRADRHLPPRTGLHTRAMRPGEWWCDDPVDRAYNRLVTRRAPPAGTAETLMRSDHLYDIVVEIGFNDRPVIRNRGSGIFWHLARPGLTPTAGCVACDRAGFLRLLARVGPHTRLRIG